MKSVLSHRWVTWVTFNICLHSCVSGIWSAVQKVPGLSVDPHSHVACRHSVLMRKPPSSSSTCNICLDLTLRFPFLSSGWCRVPPDPAGSVRPLVPHRVLRLCVGAGGSDSAQHPIRRLPDERPRRSADRTVQLLHPSLQTHLHASRWRSRSSQNSHAPTD